MAQSAAKTVDAYLEELPEECRAIVKKVRGVIRKNLPKGLQEGMAHGMICYSVPLSRYPEPLHPQRCLRSR